MTKWFIEYTLKGKDGRGNPMITGCTYEQFVRADTKENALIELSKQYPKTASVVVKRCVKGTR